MWEICIEHESRNWEARRRKKNMPFNNFLFTLSLFRVQFSIFLLLLFLYVFMFCVYRSKRHDFEINRTNSNDRNIDDWRFRLLLVMKPIQILSICFVSQRSMIYNVWIRIKLLKAIYLLNKKQEPTATARKKITHEKNINT